MFFLSSRQNWNWSSCESVHIPRRSHDRRDAYQRHVTEYPSCIHQKGGFILTERWQGVFCVPSCCTILLPQGGECHAFRLIFLPVYFRLTLTLDCLRLHSGLWAYSYNENLRTGLHRCVNAGYQKKSGWVYHEWRKCIIHGIDGLIRMRYSWFTGNGQLNGKVHRQLGFEEGTL